MTHRALICLMLAAFMGLGCSSTKPLVNGSTPGAKAEPSPPQDTSFVRAVAVKGNKGMVVSGQTLASQTGTRILQSGGNAADAAIATVAALNVVEPNASGLGGGGFCLYYDANADSFYLIDYRECAPQKMNLSDYFNPLDSLRLARRMGAKSIAVPGAAAGWQMIHDKFSTKLLQDLMAPAVALADTGFDITPKLAQQILDHVEEISSDSAMAKTFLTDGLPTPEGLRLKQPKLAKTLGFLSKTRLDNFYRAPISGDLIKTVQARGGFVTQGDLSSYSVKLRTPLRAMYHGYEIVTLTPPGGGGAMMLEILKLCDKKKIATTAFLSAEYIHTIAQASRQAQADASLWLGDPDFTEVPVDKILSDSWIEPASASLRSDSVNEKIAALDSMKAFGPGNTTHLVIIDSLGNMVSLTQTINYFFGAAVMVPELGVMLNNEMADFLNDTTSNNGLAPRHRPVSNMASTIVRKDGKPVLIIGTPGGPRIAPTMAQVLIAILDYKIPLAEALNAPRFFPAKKTLVVENRIAKPELDKLSQKGWKIHLNGSCNNFFGGVHAIEIEADGSLTGAADPRRDGAAAGY